MMVRRTLCGTLPAMVNRTPDEWIYVVTDIETDGPWPRSDTNPQPVPDVMAGYIAWIKAPPGKSLFAASPLSFDGLWIDYYLRRFTRYGIAQGPYEENRLFDGPGLCIRSYAAAVTGRPVAEISPDTLPSEWFGNVPHTHKAIDDALGYANLLVTLGGQVTPSSGTAHS